MKYLPVGLVGLLFACIFAASMSSTSGELSALATCSVVDVYKRHIKKEGKERHYVLVSRIAMACWGVYAVFFAQYASRLGSLIEAVNILGSLFYGTMLGIFLIAFYLKWIGGTATFWAAFIGEAVVLCCYLFTDISWLWYNVVGCGAVVGTATLVQFAQGARPSVSSA
jgi:Na+/proline symporter